MPTGAQLAARRALVAAAQKRRPQAPARVPPARLPPPTAYTRALTTVARELNDEISAALDEALSDAPRADAGDGPVPPFDRRGLLARLRRLAEAVVKRRGSFLDTALDAVADNVTKVSKAEWAKQAKAVVGIDLSKVEPNLAPTITRFRRANLDLITSMASDKVARVKSLLEEHGGARVETLRDKIMEERGVTKRQAALIARDQVLSLNAQVTEKRHAAAGVEKYVWRTSGDGDVRPAHRALDGKTFRYDDPPIVDAKKGRRENPGQDYQCRCTAEPVIEWGDEEEVPTPTTKRPAPRVEYDRPPPPIPARYEDVPQRTRAPLGGRPQDFGDLPVEPELQGIPLGDHVAAVQYPANRVGDEAFDRHVAAETAAALEEVSPADRLALEKYTGPAFGRVNLALREGEAAAARRYGPKAVGDVEAIAAGTDRALARLPRAPADMTLFRGLSLQSPAELDAFARATTVESPTFLSTSRDPQVAVGFGGGVNGDEPSVIYRIRRHRSGAILSSAISNASESEVLFPRGARFRVVGRQRVSASRLILDVEEIA